MSGTVSVGTHNMYKASNFLGLLMVCVGFYIMSREVNQLLVGEWIIFVASISIISTLLFDRLKKYESIARILSASLLLGAAVGSAFH